MTEDEARVWVRDRYGRDACDRIGGFVDRAIEENAIQNLLSPSSIATIWSRHVVDSAQLLTLAPQGWRSWIDVGTGGGFPGMVLALLAPQRSVTMVEPRRKRAAFLDRCVRTWSLDKAQVVAAKIEQLSDTADVISARAVASIENLLRAAGQCATAGTTWILPRGRSGREDVASMQLKRSMFHVEHSITDPESTIVVIEGDGR